MDVFVMEMHDIREAIREHQEALGEASLCVTSVLEGFLQDRKLRDLSDREKVGVMILCSLIMRFCSDSGHPLAAPSFNLCADIFSKAGALSSLEPPVTSVMELIDQLDSKE